MFDFLKRKKRFDPKNLLGEAKDAVEVVKLNGYKTQEVAERIDASFYAWGFIVLSVIFSCLGMLIFSPNFQENFKGLAALWIIVSIISGVIFSVVYIWVLHLLAVRFFSGRGYFDQLFRVMGYASIFKMINIYPGFSFISSIWYMVISWYALKKIYRLSGLDTILIILMVEALAMVFLKLLTGMGIQEMGMMMSGK